MGSSKKHKEKRDRKKHKRDRSKERDGHKKSHKSSHRRDKKKVSESEIDQQHHDQESTIRELSKPTTSYQNIVASDDEFDVDKLLDSKLPEISNVSSSKRLARKRKREEAIEELKKKQKQNLVPNEDSLEKFATEQLLEEHGVTDSSVTTRAVPSLQGVRIKEEPADEDKGYADPQLTLSIADTNKLRAKLGLKPLDTVKEHSSARRVDKEFSEAEKLREKLGLKQPTNDPDPRESEANKLRAKLGLIESDKSPETPEFTESHQHVESLSISETNKLRAKLGLKPLDVGGDIPGIEGEDGGKDVFKAAPEVFVKTENIREKKKTEALREKLKVSKEKRHIENKLRKTKGIADDSDSGDDSAATWVLKHQKILQEKEVAEKRAKLLEEMDAEFGIGALVEEEFDKKKAYTSKDLKGLTIAHDQESFVEGHQVILTLKDKGVLEEEDDVLENVNIVDNERYAKNVENKKKKPDYKAYEEPEYDEFGILKKKNMLAKYDEEIDGEKKAKFKIGTVSTVPHMTREQELELIRMKLKQQNVMSLEMPEMRMANEYLTTSEMVLFKKPKKKRKVKKGILKADDLLPDNAGGSDFGSRRRSRKRNLDDEDDSVFNPNPSSGIPLISDDIDVKPDIPNVIDEIKVENELHSALSKAKKLKERKIMATAPEKVMEILSSVNGSAPTSDDSKQAVNIELNSVAEFCRTLGDIPTYGMSGNRDEEAEDMMDLEQDLLEERQKLELDAQNQGAWNEVDVEEKPAEIMMRENEPILEEEPDISLGVAGALKLATKKGYLDKEDEKVSSSLRASQLQAQSYTIEEKFYEDDKFGKRDRYTGPVQDFKEKNNYKPDVKLEYIDDSGRLLTAKEAFRYLSHKFHGKGPGKNKVDKRMKKLDQDTRLKQMSSTDTPLNTVKLLQLKQKETQSPYIVLSGGNKTLTQTMISKTKH